MDMEIESCYKFMIENFPQFQEFVKQHTHLSTDELIEKYDLKVNKEQD